MITAWLIEFGANPVRYYCADGDWCDNANHAHKFASASEAQQKRATFVASNCEYRVVEHIWDDGP